MRKELKSEKDKEYRIWLNFALGKMGEKTAIFALLKVLGDEDLWVRSSAASVLGKIGDKAAVPALIKALRDENVGVRSYAASALGKIKDKTAVPALLNALGNENDGVRSSAIGALEKITGQDFGYDPAKWQKWWDENKDKILRE